MPFLHYRAVDGCGNGREVTRETSYQLACDVGADGRNIRVGAVVVMMTALLLAGCSGRVTAQTTAVPPASPAQASASRTYLNGNGRGLIDLDDLAGKAAVRRTPGACQGYEKNLVRLTRAGSGPAVADPGLAELFGDEFSALSSVLGQCRHGAVTASVLSTLGRVHTLVDQRLRADKARP